MKSGLHPEQITSLPLSQDHKVIQTTTSTRTHTYGHFRVPDWPHVHVFGLWEEAGVPAEDPRRLSEIMQTPHRQAPKLFYSLSVYPTNILEPLQSKYGILQHMFSCCLTIAKQIASIMKSVFISLKLNHKCSISSMPLQSADISVLVSGAKHNQTLFLRGGGEDSWTELGVVNRVDRFSHMQRTNSWQHA